MKTYTITKADLDKDNCYIGKEDLSNFQGNVESSGGLGRIKFRACFIVSGYILFGDGDSIEAGGYIKAGYSIEAGGYIKAGYSIEAGGTIEAGDFIEAGGSIKAGYSIEAGGSIKVGGSIEAGGTIICRFLSASLRIFAGTCSWKIPTDTEMEIKCEKLVKGTVSFGKLVLIEV